ncbi:MAG: hypothetical protein ABS75_22600 [Pelagibacterium sp. SCN 63-23]|nr:MAG: hypothetical protein ABS75_22600 [Pelagibacterium sp. SCN 63-23]
MSTSPARAEAPESSHGSLAYNLAGIAVLALVLAVGLAYFIDQAGRSSRPALPALTDGDPLIQTIAGRELAIPASWFRYGEQMKAGFATQVDLTFALDLAGGQVATPVEVMLVPRGRARASSTLLDAVYLHQFDEGTIGGVPGLVGKPLLPAEGYSGETVWYDALSPNPFVAKCMSPVEPKRPGQCLRTVHLPSGLAALISFEATALPFWRRFDDEMALWLGQIGAL